MKLEETAQSSGKILSHHRNSGLCMTELQTLHQQKIPWFKIRGRMLTSCLYSCVMQLCAKEGKH